MPQLQSASEYARAALHRLSELGLPPTPDNYSRLYFEVSGTSPPASPVPVHVPPSSLCEEMMQMIRSLVDKVSQRTGLLVDDLGRHSTDMQDSMAGLRRAEDKEEILQLLSAVIDKADRIHSTVSVTHEDLTATRQALDSLRAELDQTRQQLNDDPLTGAQNRRGMDLLLEREVARARLTGAALSAAMIDIDHFKQINDKHGHDAGDKVLMHVATLARSVLRSGDGFVRYGGEEFLMILPDTEGGGAAFVLNRLAAALQKSPLTYAGIPLVLTFSAGIAQLRPDENGHALVMRADRSLYRAKAAGRNRVEVEVD